MVRLNIDVSEDLQRKARARAAETGHGSVEEYVESLILADADLISEDHGAPEALEVRSSADLEQKLHDGLAGPSSEMTDSDWKRLRSKLEQNQSP